MQRLGMSKSNISQRHCFYWTNEYQWKTTYILQYRYIESISKESITNSTNEQAGTFEHDNTTLPVVEPASINEPGCTT